MLLAHAQSYETGAPGRITEYDDSRTPIHPTIAAEDLIKNASYLDAFKPGLAAHMQCMWSNPLEGADDFLYWSKESFGPSPFAPSNQTSSIRPKRVSSSVSCSQ